MAPGPLVSCVIPVWNGEEYLSEAIDSAFAQSYRPLEVIVVDDGSSDRSASVAGSYGDALKLVRQENRGPAAARNRGIQTSAGEFVGFLDADDIWLPEKLERQVDLFSAFPELDIVSVRRQNFWMPEVRPAERERAAIATGDERDGQASQVLLVRRSAFDRVGLFDERLAHRDTMEWLLRARDYGLQSGEVPEVLVRRRIHSRNRSRERGDRDRDDMLRIIQASLSRRHKGERPPN